MSYFDRPDSPPPREPSPEPVQTPLPSPHLRARDKYRQRTSSPLAPPGLAPPRPLLQSRSFDHLNRDPAHPTLKRRTRSNLDPAPAPPAAPSLLSPNRSPSSQHRRTTSVAAPYTPPTTPSRVPPVPPLPDSARSSPLFKPHYKTAVTPIFLPELHDLSPVSQHTLSAGSATSTASEKKSIKRLPSLFSISSAPGTISSKVDSSNSSSSSTEKEAKAKNNVAMTCFKFFTMHRHSSNRSLRSSANTQ